MTCRFHAVKNKRRRGREEGEGEGEKAREGERALIFSSLMYEMIPGSMFGSCPMIRMC